MKEFAEVFNLGINFFNLRGAQINLQEFKEDLAGVDLDLSCYEKNRYIIYAMIGLKPVN